MSLREAPSMSRGDEATEDEMSEEVPSPSGEANPLSLVQIEFLAAMPSTISLKAL